MTLRKKTILVVASTLFFMGFVLYTVAHTVLSKSYTALETDDIIKTTEQLSTQLKEDLTKLGIIVGDWAPWDDTYRFIRDLNSDYIENNLAEATLSNLDVDFMVFIDIEGRVKYWKGAGVSDVSDENWETAFHRLWDRNSKLSPQMTTTVTGYAILQGNIAMLAAAPILTSKFEGPSRGILLVGRYLDASAVQLIEDKLKYPVKIKRISSEAPPETDRLTSDSQAFRIIRSDRHAISSALLVSDLTGHPLFSATITKPRTIMQQGRKSLTLFLTALSFICLVFAAVTLIFLEKKVLYRLLQLSEAVTEKARRGESEDRLPVIGQDEIATLSASINDMLDKLEENKKNYKKLFESASDAILLLKDGKIVDCNLSALRLFGYAKDQIVGRDPCFFSPEIQPDGSTSHDSCRNMMTAVSPGEQMLFEWVYLKKDQTPFETEVNLTAFDLTSGRHLQAIIRDISERKRSQRTMIQAEKMLSLGGLAAGMAHEINNPLAGMMQNAQVIKNRLSTALPANVTAAEEIGISVSVITDYMKKRHVFKLLQSINDSGEKAARIVNNMLSFARKNDSEKSPENIVEILDNTIELAQTDYDLKSRYDFKQIEIIREYESGLLNVNCHRSNLQQVFFNILKNAGAALFSAKQEIQAPKLFLRILKDKAHVKIEIEDNGPGIDDTIQKRIFEPFFTTKKPGEGTGLGLSVSYFIITEDHNGEILVESERGKGTTFIIRLPLIVE